MPESHDATMLNQLIAGLGAALVLGAYLALQRGWLAREDRSYNALNFVGAALLTWVALEDRRWGFIVLEGAWALLSVPGMLRRGDRTPPSAGAPA
jgi:drug/metabolite transporter (DMT)-like permease